MDQNANEQSHPLVNLEEFVGKIVGRRKPRSPAEIQRIGLEIYRVSRFRVCDPGVYRFSSHEEANEWNLQMAIKRAHLAAKS